MAGWAPGRQHRSSEEPLKPSRTGMSQNRKPTWLWGGGGEPIRIQSPPRWGRGETAGAGAPRTGVQAASPRRLPARASVTASGGQVPPRQHPRRHAAADTQLAGARPRRGTGALQERNSKQQIRHNQHAATHTGQTFLQTRFSERIARGAQREQNRGGGLHARGAGEQRGPGGCSAAGRGAEGPSPPPQLRARATAQPRLEL